MNHSEALAGSKHAYENAIRHKKVAEVIAKKKEYGMACSHLVLGAEETVKSHVMFLYGVGLIPFKTLKKYMFSHKPRHDFLGIVFTFTYPMGIYVNGMLELESKSKKREIDWDKERGTLVKRQCSWLTEGHKSDVFFNSTIEWCKQADSLKIRGLYADLFDGTWSNPSDITKAEYNNSVHIFNQLFGSLTAFQSLNSGEQAELVKLNKNMQSNFIKGMIDKGYTQKEANQFLFGD